MFLNKILIQKFLYPPDERPTTQKAYSEAITYYTMRYLTVTSISSAIFCLLNIPSIGPYFQGQTVQTYIETDKRFLITKLFRYALLYCNPNNFNYELLRMECLKLRLLMYSIDDKANRYVEIPLYYFMGNFLNKLHEELNKNDQTLGQTLNFEEEINKDGNIDWTNEKSVISASVTLFSNKFKSKITDQFYYLSKICHECPECKRIIKYSCKIYCICSMYPERAAKYLNKTELNINDLSFFLI